MSAARTNALLVPVKPDPRLGEELLGHVAERLSARLPRYLASVSNADVAVDASTGGALFGEWSTPETRAYHIGSSGIMIVRVDVGLAGMLLEYQLGGAASGSRQPDRKQGRAAASLIHSIADVVSLAVADGWPGGSTAQIAATDDGTQLARNDDRVATITLAVSTLGAIIGHISIAFPIEGLARVSGPPASPRDGEWSPRLRESVLAARLPVRAVLARPELSAAVVLRLAIGDVLPISKPEIVPLYSGDQVVGNGAIIEIAGRTAVQFKMTEPCND